MDRPRNFYQPLKDEHKAALDAFHKSIGSEDVRAPGDGQNQEANRDAHEEARNAFQNSLDSGSRTNDVDASNLQLENTPTETLSPDAAAEPTRPAGHYGDRQGWTGMGGMEHQQKSALDYIKNNEAQRDQGQAGFEESNGKGPSANDMKPPEPDINNDPNLEL